MQLPYNLLCFDIETTGIDKSLSSVIQIGAVIVNKEFEIDATKGEFSMHIKPLDSYRHPKAMEINQISEETLSTAMSLNDALICFENFCGKCDEYMLMCWGSDFDIPFLKEQYKKIDRKWPFNYRKIDMRTIAIWESAKRDTPISGRINKFLESINKVFDGDEHDGLADIKNSVSILQYYKNGRND